METMTSVPLYSIVIPTLGNHDLLWQTLAHLQRTDLAGAEVIVVFNGLPENRNTVEHSLEERFPSVRLLVTPEPYGIARAYNLGARAGSGRFVAFLHDDVLIDEPRWLSLLTGVLERRSDVGLVGGSEPKYTDRSPSALGELEPGVVECDWSPTISVIRRSDFETCFFDEFYLVGLEDKDWALSFRRKGLKVVCRKVAHTHVGTKGSYTLLLNDRRLLDYYSKEGVRERHFLTKNNDVLDETYLRAGWKKWARWDRNWRKRWWMKLYVHSFYLKIKRAWVDRSTEGDHRILDGAMNGLALVLPLSIALSNILWGAALLLWGLTLITERPRYRWTGLEIPWLSFLGIGLLTAILSARPLHSVHSFRSDVLVVVFLLASQTGSAAALRKRLAFFAVGATAAACFGILQRVLGLEGTSALTAGPPLQGIARLLSLHAGRVQGFYNHPVTYAEMLLLAGTLIIGFWLQNQNRKWGAAVLSIGGAILFSQTRGVWIATALTLGGWGLLRRDKKIGVILIACVVLFASFLALSPNLRSRAVSLSDTKKNESNLIRLGLWDQSLRLIRQNPMGGIGGGNFSVLGKDLRWGGAPAGSQWTETHSIYLQIAVERGLPGLAVFLWFLAGLGRRLWKAGKTSPPLWGIFFGFVGMLIAGMTETWTNDSEVMMCVYFLVGTAWALGVSAPDLKVIKSEEK